MSILWQKVPHAFQTTEAPAHSYRRETVFLRNLLQGFHTVDPPQEPHAILSPTGIYDGWAGCRSFTTATVCHTTTPFGNPRSTKPFIGSGVIMFRLFFFTIYNQHHTVTFSIGRRTVSLRRSSMTTTTKKSSNQPSHKIAYYIKIFFCTNNS